MALGFCNIVLVMYEGLGKCVALEFRAKKQDPLPRMIGLGALIFLSAFLTLTVLKVFMAYQCESHLWNSLTGCVPLSAVANATNTTADVAGNATAAASKALGLPTLFT